MRNWLGLGVVALCGTASGCTTWNCLASCVGGGTSGTVQVCAFSEDGAKAASNAGVTAGCGGAIIINSCVNSLAPCGAPRDILLPTADPISE